MVREDDASVDTALDSSPGETQLPKIRSQYPADSDQNHVEYILVASFDIDRGSVMEHQYPGPISGDETMLAELMLPDQAHVRSQDWTVFFLHKDTTTDEDEKDAVRRGRRGRENGDADDDTSAGAEETDAPDDELDPDGPPLVYVLNLVNTKQDNTVKRQVSSGNHSSLLANKEQRRHRESHGNMHPTPLLAHL